MSMKTYRWAEHQFPDAIILQKEGCFFEAHHRSAKALGQYMDYVVYKDPTGNDMAGGPDINRICNVLERYNVSYIILENERVTYGFQGLNPFEHTVL